ncbi:hypothetical protein GIB67_019569 [Kingdonia uniflora]|uniref:Uncharacterized protein n=1 Tax=Kingdonia uniflora TaxID=39325 RepID=A0A7J7N0B2_9MAGN|nr:hypothetical protein GIB67_019569 [Kingdonia uniflora]
MEESEIRKERLKSMRMEASQPQNPDTCLSPAHLSNPFAATQQVHEAPPTSVRFDFYTDPLAAFSANKRKQYQASPIVQPQPSLMGSTNLGMSPTPSHQNHTGHFSDPRMNQLPLPYQGSIPWRTPVGLSNPGFVSHGTPQPWNTPGGSSGYVSPHIPSHVGGLPSPNYGRGSSPSPNYWRGGSPCPNYGRGGNPSPNYGRGGNPSPNYGQRGSPRPNYGQRGSPRPNYGRGGSPRPNFEWGDSPNPNSGGGFGRGLGRGRGSHSEISARERPEMFYNKSMIEDPWRFLNPTVKVLKSWLPKSIYTKKGRISETTSEFKSSEQSLAEYLAASLEEASRNVVDS